MIRLSREQETGIEWAIILNTNHHVKLFRQLLGPERVLVADLRGKGPEWRNCGPVRYPGDLFGDIEAQKRTFKHLPAEEQVLRALHLYKRMSDFAEGFAPSHALVSQVEGFDGKAFIAAARNAGAEIVVPTGCRNIGGTFFSPDDRESLPAYANPHDPDCLKEAEDIIKSFREKPAPAWHPPSQKDDDALLDNFRMSFAARSVSALKRFLENPESMEFDHIRVSFLNNLPLIRDGIWKARRAVNQRLCGICSFDRLPPKFIYYPLQYSPESSINTPAPYFVDQLRAIDSIRFAMPSDYRLVVKEHPACILVRPGGLVKSLLSKAGVSVAHYSLSGLELIRRSSLVVSVTGTATLEALLLGKQAVTLGNSLVSSFLGGAMGSRDLKEVFKERLGRPLDESVAIKAIATLLSVRYKAIFASPNMPGEPVLRRENVRSFLDAFVEHCLRADAIRARAGLVTASPESIR